MTVEILLGDNYHSSISFLINNNILVDCGEKVISKYINTDKLNDIEYLFISNINPNNVSGFIKLLKFLHDKNQPLKIYGSNEFLDYYYNLMCDTCFYNEYCIKSFSFIDFNNNYTPIFINEDFLIEHLESDYSNYNYISHSFIFNNFVSDKRIIITGESKRINPLISKELMDSGNILLFQDMSYEINDLNKYPTEEEVFNFYGKNDNILGVQSSTNLKYYQHVKDGDIFDF